MILTFNLSASTYLFGRYIDGPIGGSAVSGEANQDTVQVETY